MAFFGLTAMGPQNSFQASLVDFSYLDVFTSEDQEEAFRAADVTRKGYLQQDEMSTGMLAAADRKQAAISTTTARCDVTTVKGSRG